MPNETTAIAQRLRAYLTERLGTPVGIVKKDEPHDGPAIVVHDWSSGDIYAGGYYTDELSFSSGDLTIRFEMCEHDLSGQCDTWQASVSGARADERETFRELFHSRQRKGHWGNHARIEYTFNGETLGF